MKFIKQLYKSIDRKSFFDCLLFISSIFLFLPNIKWIFDVFFSLYDYFNLFLLLLISCLIFHKCRGRKLPKHIRLDFQFKKIPFTIVIIALTLWFYGSNILGINIISSTAFCLYIFGVSGFYISTQKWIKSIIPFGLLIMTLPFGNMMDVYIGFPLRMIAIDSIASLFGSMGLENVTSSTIITIENHATQIDFSCSGLKGLWSGLIFFFALTWMEQLKINLKWLFALLLLFSFLLLSNLFRILIIIVLNSIAKLPEIAEIIHAPLGVIGFVFSCVLILSLIRTKWYLNDWKSVNINLTKRLKPITPNYLPQYKFLRETLTSIVIGVLFISSTTPSSPLEQFSMEMPQNWNTTPLELTSDETQFFKEQNSVPVKLNFELDSLNGSLLILKSNGWRGHHNPEFCIRAGGALITEVSTKKLDPNFPIKWMQINDTSSACYWFQSPTSITDDFSTRVWSEVKKEQTEWILVTVVFNDQGKLEDKNIQEFLNQLNLLINNQLNSSNKLITNHEKFLSPS